MHNFLCPHVLCENVRPPVSTFPWVRMFMRHLCMYSLGQWSDQRYYVIKHVLSDLRGQPLPTAGDISTDFGCCRSFASAFPIFSIMTPFNICQRSLKEKFEFTKNRWYCRTDSYEMFFLHDWEVYLQCDILLTSI